MCVVFLATALPQVGGEVWEELKERGGGKFESNSELEML